MRNLKTAKFFGVEVKQGENKITPEQKTMFAALETAGLKIVIWNPRHPERFTPWRSYIPERKQRNRRNQPLHVMTTREQFRVWQGKARASGMTLREWVTRALDSAPIFRVDVTPVEEKTLNEGR